MNFAVVGDPVDHSLSPVIHNACFDYLGIRARYTTMRIPEGDFGRAVAALRSGDLDGINVTMPLKAEAFAGVDTRSRTAKRSLSVNTVVSEGGVLVGHNTDVGGVVYAVERLRLDPNTPVLILGAGGAARAAAVAMEDRELSISTRNPQAAAELLESTVEFGEVLGWQQPVEGAVVINATPIGMRSERLSIAVIEGAAGFVDMAYGDQETPSTQLAKRLGIPVSDGIDTLIGQASEAFALFVGQRPPIEVMEHAARNTR